MVSAAGIIMATGAMTLINDAIQQPQSAGRPDPFIKGGDANIIDNVDWKIIPATAIAAGIFWGLEQGNASVAKGLAMLAFFTALIVPIRPVNGEDWKLSPLGTLLQVTTGYPSANGYVFYKGAGL
jgi:hypothetical protein